MRKRTAGCAYDMLASERETFSEPTLPHHMCPRRKIHTLCDVAQRWWHEEQVTERNNGNKHAARSTLECSTQLDFELVAHDWEGQECAKGWDMSVRLCFIRIGFGFAEIRKGKRIVQIHELRQESCCNFCIETQWRNLFPNISSHTVYIHSF